VTVRVLHLVGSPTSTFYADLSRLYAGGCLAATADPGRWEPHVAYLTPDGRWRFPAGLSAAALAAARPLELPDAVARITDLAPDVMVPHLFCLPGMTAFRALFDVIGIPFVGNRPDVMALGAHKARAKAVVASAGVRVPAGQVLGPGGAPAVAPPAVVKPVDADNSSGVTLVRDPAGYPAALEAALDHSDRALVEEYVPLGREVRCGVLERAGSLECLPLEEYAVDPGKPVRDHDDKIAPAAGGGLRLEAKDDTRAWIVDPADPVTAPVWEAAGACHEALGCRHYSLFDFRVDPGGRPWFLEAGLYCSFSPQSVIAMMAAAAGTAVRELFAAVLTEALRA
jgi:D-alanine-D-alanine ligase